MKDKNEGTTNKALEKAFRAYAAGEKRQGGWEDRIPVFATRLTDEERWGIYNSLPKSNYGALANTYGEAYHTPGRRGRQGYRIFVSIWRRNFSSHPARLSLARMEALELG